MVYVDDMHEHGLGQYGRMKMSHMIADSTEELLAMARTIGVQVKWIQHPTTYREHFDIAKGKRAAAIKAGAISITMREYARMVDSRRRTDPGSPLVYARS